MAEIYSSALAFYGKDLIGLSMAADWQKEMRHSWACRPPEMVEEIFKKHGLKNNRSNMSIPMNIFESKDGLGVYLNPDSRKEIIVQFDFIASGFSCKGVGLNPVEKQAFREFLYSQAINFDFVRRMISEFGDKSIKSSFQLEYTSEAYWLDYLIRCHNGSYFRNNYPAISIV